MTISAKICSEENCDQPAKVKGLCQRCYSRLYQRERNRLRKLNGTGIRSTNYFVRGTCKMWKCDEPEHSNYLCKQHAEEVYGSFE